MTLSSLLAAFRGLLSRHHSPADPMPDNTALADATQKLKDATAALQLERQHTAAQAQQLVQLQQQYDTEHAARVAAESHAADLQQQLDALPDAPTVAAAVAEMTQDAGVIGTSTPAPAAPTVAP